MINLVKFIAIAFFAVAALATPASAQITPRPASWTAAGTDGLNAFLTPLTAAQITDFTAAGVNISSHGTVPLPPGFVQGKPFPPVWFNPLGGSVTVKFLGESAGWQDDFGYVLNPSLANLTSPSVYNPLVVNVQSSFTGTPTSTNLVNNTETTITYGAGDKIDFFLNGVGDPSDKGGTWFAFGTPNQFNGTDNTVHTKYRYANIDGLNTLIVAFDDSRIGQPYTTDGDFTDFIIAFQGVTPPVPEPSTYGLIGAVALLGLVGIRRFKHKA